MVNRLDDRPPVPSRTRFILDPAEALLARLAESPGLTLVEKAAALNSEARQVLTPILANLDTLVVEAKPGLLAELNTAIARLDRRAKDVIEDGNYGGM